MICGGYVVQRKLSRIRDNSWKNGEFNNLLSNIKFKDKYNLKPIAIICPSKWLMKISKKSKIYSKKIINIPYPINQKFFS